MTAVNKNKGAGLDGDETGGAPHRTRSHPPSSSLRALSSYRLKRLSLKKRPRVEQIHDTLSSICTAKGQLPVGLNPEAPGDLPEGLARAHLSSAAAAHKPAHSEQSTIQAPGACLGSRTGRPAGRDVGGQSGACFATLAGLSGASDGLPVPTVGLSEPSVPGRQPLQAWVPRKRNLASFDALDELSILTRQKQHPAGVQGLPVLSQSGSVQEGSAGLPLRAPGCLPRTQEPALHGAYLPGRLTVPAAGLPENLQGAAGRHARHAQGHRSGAPGTDLAGSSQLPWRTGKSAPSQHLHHQPFAPPRPTQREADASDRPSANDLASAACANDAGQILEDSSAALPHRPSFHPGKHRDANLVSSSAVGALDGAGIISDSEPSEASDTAPDRQPSGTHLADAASMLGACSRSPLMVPSDETLQGQAPQLITLPDRQEAEETRVGGSPCAQSLPSGSDPSHGSGIETATPAAAKPAGATAQGGKRAQSGCRKRLKRLYSTDAGPGAHKLAVPIQDAEGEGVDGLAHISTACRGSPGCIPRKDKMMPSRGLTCVRAACRKPGPGPAVKQDREASGEDTDSLDTSNSPDHSPAAHWQNSGRGLKRLRRMTDVYPEATLLKPAGQAGLKANPFKSGKAALPQEPRLACHAAPAQPQCNTLSDDLSCGDMQALLRGHEEPKQTWAERKMDAAPEAPAGGIIDLASEGSSGCGEGCAGSPAHPPRRRICLPELPSSPKRRSSQGCQPRNRSYLGAYSSAEVMPEPAHLGTAQAVLPAYAQSEISLDKVWLGSRHQRTDCSRGTGAPLPQISSASHLPASRQRDSLLDGRQDRQPEALGAQRCGAQSDVGAGGPAQEVRSAMLAEAGGASRQPRRGAPWWHHLEDFVPVAAIRDSRDPRDGTGVMIDYRAQFSGDKHPAAASGGFQQAKRGRKAQRDAPAARATEATHEGGSSMGHWLTTHQNGRRKKVYVTAGGRMQLTGAAAHKAYERDKRAAGSFAVDT